NSNEEKDIFTSNNVTSSENETSIKEKTITGKGFFFDMALFIGIFLLLLHIYLCYKLYAIDQTLSSFDIFCLNQCKQGSLFHLLFLIMIFLLIYFFFFQIV